MGLELKITQTIGDTIEITKNVMTVSIADYEIGLAQMLEAEQSNTTTATGDITLTDSDKVMQFIDPGGSDRNVTLPAESIDNHGFLIVNTADADETITVKDDAANIIGYVGWTGIGWFVSNGSAWEAAYAGSITANPVCEGRLTLESGVSVSTSDQADKTTLYFTPHIGDRVSIYNGSAWVEHTFTERSLDISGFTASKNYDIFIHDAGGTLTLTGLVWTNDTTRATAITKLGGIYVKDGASEYRYLGTIRMDAAQKCQDKESQRWLWNYYNQAWAKLLCKDTTDTWNYTTTTFRAANNNTSDGVGRYSVVVGVAEDISRHFSIAAALNASSLYARAGIGLDITNDTSTDLSGRQRLCVANNYFELVCEYITVLPIGYHFLQRVEKSDAAGTTTWAGDAGGDCQAGMTGWIKR